MSVLTARLASVFALLLWGVLPAAAQQPQTAPPGPVGEWEVAKRVARITIADCDNRLWGVVSWEARPGVDSKNSDERLRGRPTLGMPVLLGLRQTGANKWQGQIYNSEDGRTYDASISMRDENTLRVQGCFLGVLCGGESWTRVEEQEPPTTGRSGEPSSNDSICSSLPGATRPSH